MKRILSVLLVLSLLVLLFAGCTKIPDKPDFDEATTEPTTVTEDKAVNVEITKKLVGMGAVYFMNSVDNEIAVGDYTYTQVDTATADFDFAILPTDEAYALVKSSEGKYQFAAVAAENNISFVEMNDKASSVITDLKGYEGKFYVGEKDSLTDKVVRFLFNNNEIKVGTDITISYQYDEETISSLIEKGKVLHCAISEPYASEGVANNESERTTLDVSTLWEQTVSGTDYLGSRICSAVIVVNTEFASSNPSLVSQFLKEYNSSVKNLSGQTGASDLVVKYGYLESADNMADIIARSNYDCVKGSSLKTVLGGFLSAIYEEEIPDTYFYMA